MTRNSDLLELGVDEFATMPKTNESEVTEEVTEDDKKEVKKRTKKSESKDAE